MNTTDSRPRPVRVRKAARAVESRPRPRVVAVRGPARQRTMSSLPAGTRTRRPL